MKALLNKIASAVFCLLVVGGCKRAQEPVPQPAGTENTSGTDTKRGNILIELQHLANGQSFTPNVSYSTASGKELITSNWTYYVCNFGLGKPDGTWILARNSAFLVQLGSTESTLQLQLQNIPEGNYDKCRFAIGIDSTSLASLGQTGILSAETGLYEDGKLLAFSLKGKTTHGSTTIAYTLANKHGGQYNTLQTVEMKFGNTLLMVKQNAVPMVHVGVELMSFFEGEKLLDISKTPICLATNDSLASALSSNLPGMFQFQHIHN